MDHSDDKSDFAPDDNLCMQQEIMLLKMKAFQNSRITEEEFLQQEREIRDRYFNNFKSGED